MYVCGQSDLINKIDRLVEVGTFPHVFILAGDSGSGKRVLSEYISHKLGAYFVPCGLSVEDVRNTIIAANSTTEKCLYMFAAAETMSDSAANCLLKITEECPEKAFFALTARDLYRLLETIVNRSQVFNMNPYSIFDLKEFIEHRKIEFKAGEKNIALNVCSTPGDIIYVSDVCLYDVYDLADKFVEFIGDANLSNSLKIISMLRIKKEDTDKIDIDLFLRCILYLASTIAQKSNEFKMCTIVSITSKYIGDVNRFNPNKELLMSNYIIDLHTSLRGA